MKKVNYDPKRVYNCDEIGLTIVQHKTTKVISQKCIRQVVSVSSAVRSSLVMIVTCMGATGNSIPLILVFPQKNKIQSMSFEMGNQIVVQPPTITLGG